MEDAGVVIVGAGVAGLMAAHRLGQAGIDHLVLEARETCGGRIAAAPGGFDLGATWFWPELQPELDTLIRSLGLASFVQPEEGDLLWERSADRPAERIAGFVSSPPSMRVDGGMVALVEALRERIAPRRIRTGWRVRRLSASGPRVEAICEEHDPCSARHVLLALPPRLAMQSIEFTPALPSALADRWRGTDTWMAPHAKYLATFDEPFWRQAGLSGAARSAAGPLGEIHDASLPGRGAALFGFLGVPAAVRARVPEASLRALCRAQLARLFGEQAGHPTGEWLKDWAVDPLTATADDAQAGHDHPAAPAAAPASGSWAGRLVGIGSEWSPRFSGYVAGALDAVTRGLDSLISGGMA